MDIEKSPKSKADKFNKIYSSQVDEVEDFTNCEGLIKIFKQSVWPIIGSLFHPSYLLVNSVILGQIKCDPTETCIPAKTYLAAFGLGSSLMSIILTASGLCYCIGLSNILPQAYASKNYKLCGAYLNRMLITSTCIFAPLLLPL
jgi:Na+-driven multidrug efflux pump